MTHPDGYDLTKNLEADIARLGELQEELKASVFEREAAEIAVLKSKTKERTTRDEAKMITSRMIATQALLEAVPR